MVVRVRVKLNPRLMIGRLTETSAIANSGYESPEPEVVIPEALARRLGLFPELPSGTIVEEYRSMAGVAKVHYIPKALEVSAVTEDVAKGPVVVGVAISGGEDEVLLSDKLIDALSIVLVRPGEGLWKFTDDPDHKVRSSERPEKW